MIDLVYLTYQTGSITDGKKESNSNELIFKELHYQYSHISSLEFSWKNSKRTLKFAYHI